jgi:T5SS/PEP-CTERM-associated repeat protein
MRHAFLTPLRAGLIVGLLVGTVLGPRSSEAQYTANYQTNTISAGPSSNWVGSAGYVVGSNYVFDALVLTNNSVLSNGTGCVGYEIGASNNSVVVSGTGSAWSNSSSLIVGYSGSINSLVITNGGTVYNGGYGYISYTSTSSGNSVLVAGSGSVWNSYDLLVGYHGGGDSLVISNGGKVVNSVGYIGWDTGANNNSVLVGGNGSAWTNSDDLYVGEGGSGNSLVISNGGVVVNAHGYVGYISSASNNSVVVSGTGSVWSNLNDLAVGEAGIGNSLVIINGGTVVVSSNMFVGHNSGSSNNFMVLNGGTLTVNNKLVMSNGAALWYGLGTSNPTVTTSNLTLAGTLNITDGGGFTNGTYTLFSYSGTLTTNGSAGILTIGTTPNTSWIYTVDISTTGYVKLTAEPPPAPVITTGLTVTNAVLQVGNVAVVVAGDTNVFSVVATNLGPSTLSYQWSFGDGVTNAWSSSGAAEHAYTNCGPYTASVTISNGWAVTTSNFTVTVACELDIASLRPKLNFAKTNADSCTVKGGFDLPSDYDFAGKLATLDIGGTNVSFTLDNKGKWHDSLSTFNKPTYKKKTGLWTLNAKLKNGSLQSSWAMYGMTNSTILKPGVLVTNFPVILLLDTEAFMGTTNLHYTAKHDKSGSAK